VTISESVTIPINTISAYVEILLSGNSNEEFWYSNIIDEVEDQYFGKGNISQDDGPFREGQLIIDGRLAGIVFPYPVIFSGGIILSWWRPMMSYAS
jgi:hypothetical protein